MDGNMYMMNQQFYAQPMIPVNNMMVNQNVPLHNNHINQAAYYQNHNHINHVNHVNHVNANPVNVIASNGKGTPNKMVKGDSKKPKGRMSAYTFFVQTCREEHRKKHPNENVNFTEFSKKCAERWKQMTDKEKKRFSEMAERDKARYDKEMSNYTPPAGEGGRNKRKKKDPNAPKRPLSAFFLFCHDERPSVKAVHPTYSVGEVAKDLGEKWQKVSAEVKAKYEAKAAADKTRYEKDMANYRNKKN